MTYSHSFPFFLNLLDSFDELFSKFKPKTIFLLYETGPLVLPIIIAAKKYKIKTVGFAHSIIPKLWAKEMYLYRKDTPLCFRPSVNEIMNQLNKLKKKSNTAPSQ